MGTVIILQGIPGSGKSTWATEIFAQSQFEHTPVDIVSADHYMVDVNGNFCFETSRISECHAKSFRKFVDWMRDHSFGTIIVDNCNTKPEDVSPYALAAQAFGFDFKIVRIVCDRETALQRNVHNVPSHTIARQEENLRNFRGRPDWKIEEVRG